MAPIGAWLYDTVVKFVIDIKIDEQGALLVFII